MFCEPLEDIKPPLISEGDVKAQFDGIQKLHEVHRKYLAVDVSLGDEHDGLNNYGFNFADLFEDLSKNMHLYSEYLVYFESNMQRRYGVL